MKNTKVSVTPSLIFILLFTAAFIFIHWLDLSIITGNSFLNTFLRSKKTNEPPVEINCTYTCPETIPATRKRYVSSSEKCPEYFRWIEEDLKPWKEEGVTREMVERAGNAAHIRIVVVKGRVHVKQLRKVYQTRDVFTVWGILQLLRLYPGHLPDLDLMFGCGDKPVVKKSDYLGENAKEIPPLLHYCGSNSTWDIPFPDWSFWGWPELKIKPWDILREDLDEGKHKVEWMKREPYAFWKGNPRVSQVRKKLLHCNLTEEQDWGALIYILDWGQEKNQTFKNTDLANQCTHRYKIYVEGVAWSVSEKYILACDSMTLVITPHYHDFFTRSLVPTVHYWPINEEDKCRSIKFAVDWGNNHPKKAQKIGKAGSKFIHEELKMKHVYDYMFHLLQTYGNLLKYEPSVPEGSVEVCLETLACSGGGLKKKFKLNSMVKGPSNRSPCVMPPPYNSKSLENFIQKKENLKKQVEMWEDSEKDKER